MKRTLIGAATAMVFSAALAALWAQEQAAAPTYKDGDYWWYRFAGRIYELTIVAGKLKIYDPKPDQKVEVEDERAEILSGLVAVGEPDRQLLQFPLYVGKEWRAEFDSGKRTPGGKFGKTAIMRHVEVRVNEIGNVSTSAGTFSAFKIERREFQRKKEVGSGAVYYSPETRSVVKYEYGFPGKATKVVELTKYGSGK